MDDVLTLIAETYTVNTIGVRVATESRRTVWAHEKSLTRADWYYGARAGLNPSLVVSTPSVNYSGEKIAEWKGVRYAVYRTYTPENSDETELYLERRTGA